MALRFVWRKFNRNGNEGLGMVLINTTKKLLKKTSKPKAKR